jgi:putative cell wall-binding protein
MESLKKLKSLCDASNRRYKAGQNDDDQVKALFNYAKKNTSVCVVIGYDSYDAITAEEVLNFYKQNPSAEIKIEKDFSYLKMNYSNVQILSKLLN